MSIAPKLPKIHYPTSTTYPSPFPSHYPLSADYERVPADCESVYVSTLKIITQSGITNRGEWRRGGGAAVSMLPWSKALVVGTAAVMACRDTSDLFKYSQTNNTHCVLTSMWLALRYLTQRPRQGQCCTKPTHIHINQSVSSRHHI